MTETFLHKVKDSCLEKWKKPSLKSIMALSFLLLGIWILFQTTEFGINKAESLPFKFFLTIKDTSFKRGDIVAIKGHDTKYYPNITFIKRVVGIPGDEITYQDNKFLINGVYGGDLLEKTSFDKLLTPLQNKIIPDGYLFLKGDHPRSFDSRYQEFGLVRVESIKGRAVGIW